MMKRLITMVFALLIVVFTSNSFADTNVTFQVNMGIYMQLTTGGFNPATDSVVVRGSFEHFVGQSDWAGYYFLLAKSNTNDSIYTLTVPFPDSVQGQTISFKYVFVHNATDTWESDPNREYKITTDANQIIALDYFNRRSSLGVTIKITFQADMTDLLNEGFNPSTDSIEARGDTYPLDWGPGKVLQQDLIDPTLFKVDLEFTGTPGSPIQFKFHADPQAKFTNTGWEAGDNHTFTFPSADTIVGPLKPAINVGGQTTADDTVYFRVDMAGAKEKYHSTTIAGLKSVWVGGGVPPLHWPSNWLFTDTASGGNLIRLYDDGSATHGDSLAGDNVWSTKQIFPPGSTTPAEFKYAAVFSGVDTLNGGASYLDNEAGFGLNHSISFILTGGTIKLWNKFGDQVITGIKAENTNTIPKQYTLTQNYPNPFNPTTNISFTLPKGSNITLKVYNILGQEVATIFQGFQNAGKYTATFDGANLASGIYFYSLHADNFNMTKKMILMK
jgi:Secretion system C-terminal sorting domain/Starch binding domain